MDRKKVTTVDAYLKTAPKEAQVVLRKLRSTILSVVPEAEERISYMIPAYMYKRKPLVYFAVQKNFLSLYGISKKLIAAYSEELKRFEIENTTIHFTPQKPLPVSLVKKFIRDRVHEIDALQPKKAKKPIKRKRYPMPLFVKKALMSGGLMGNYTKRPPYQRNDYIGWITSAKLEVTKQKRLAQMLAELKVGNLYMKMRYNARK